MEDTTNSDNRAAGGGGPSGGFVLRIYRQVPTGWLSEDRPFGGGVVSIGRDESCDVVLKSELVSRRHAEIRPAGQGFVVVDLGSRNGVWLNDARQAEIQLGGGERFRIGEWWLEFLMASQAVAGGETIVGGPRDSASPPAPPPPVQPPVSVKEPEPAPAVEARESTTIIKPVFEATTPLARAFEEEESDPSVSAQRSFFLDDPQSVWFVAFGTVEIHSVAVEGGVQKGRRKPLGTVRQGECLFGVGSPGDTRALLAVSSMNTVLRKMSMERFRELTWDDTCSQEIAEKVESWISSLSTALTWDETLSAPDVVLQDGVAARLKTEETARPLDRLLWIDVREGGVTFGQMEEDPFSIHEITREKAEESPESTRSVGLLRIISGALRKRPPIPVSPATWIKSMATPGLEVSVLPRSTMSLLTDTAMWEGLTLFHAVLLRWEAWKEGLEVHEESERLTAKQENDRVAQQRAQEQLAEVLDGPSKKARTGFSTGDPVLDASRLVGEALRVKIVDHPEVGLAAPYDDRVAAIAKASRIRTRVVALREDWWKRDQGALLARTEKDSRPIALLPDGTSAYSAVDPTTGKTFPVDEKIAAGLAPFAYAFYPSFPDGEITAAKMIRFGALGLKRDFAMLVAMAIFLGLLGTLTPIFTGRLFDTAIPEAEGGLLVQFCVALFLAAFVSAAFKLTQSIAVLRIQGKMDYKLQAAVWDRLLNLPSTFFRDYSSGDLADRAGGVDQIRSLIAGAGISSVLGSLSSLFYIGLMFKFNAKMAGLAILLTLIFVSFSWGMNYLQLRYQRRKMTMQGAITGLVLQLISGVSKIRVSGAESHAYGIWVEKYSGQRHLEIRIGKIQNVVQVFNSGFSVIASMAIFWTLMSVIKGAQASGTRPMSIGEFIAFNSAYGAFQGAMQAMSQASLDLLRVVPIFERLRPILTTPAEITEAKRYPGRLKGAIELSHVSFRYTDDGPLILDDVSLKIRPGEFVAFVGPSGCGKSTLMRLLLGFEKPLTGSIYYDGNDLKDLDVREIRQQMGVVLQNSRLFPAEIYRNIIGTTSLTIDNAWEAARLAGLADDIEEMPMGMHTYVSEGGGGLSGGQRQRLLIARSLVRRPRILFFDEATSALDNRSQAVVTESMEKLESARIVIAHRLSTIINADKICYMEGGKIQESGSYESLMAQRGKFYLLASRQVA